MSKILEQAGANGAVTAIPTQRPLALGAWARAWVRLLRPWQWVKNAFVLAPLVFSGQLADAGAVSDGLLAFVLFCLLASGIYAWNDVADAAQDRAHPIKRHRPVAAGAISAGSAAAGGVLLVGLAVVGGWAVAPGLAAVLFGYLLLNVLYTFQLKSMVILDVFSIAAFFILRLLAGCAALGITPTVWLLLCGGLLALYLGFAKRRHELLLLQEDSRNHRAVLQHYDAALLDQMSTILLAVTVVAYIMYTLNSGTAAAVGSEALSYSTVFVLYGVFRYLWLAHQSRGSHNGGDPAETLLTDPSLLTAVLCWLAYCGWAIYRPF